MPNCLPDWLGGWPTRDTQPNTSMMSTGAEDFVIWFSRNSKTHHRDTERTQRLHREEGMRDFFVQGGEHGFELVLIRDP